MKWLIGMGVFFGLAFVLTCILLVKRERADAQKNATRRLSDYAEQAKPTPPQLIGRNGRSNRTGAPINRRVRGA